jgi:hypothetical protein
MTYYFPFADGLHHVWQGRRSRGRRYRSARRYHEIMLCFSNDENLCVIRRNDLALIARLTLSGDRQRSYSLAMFAAQRSFLRQWMKII